MKLILETGDTTANVSNNNTTVLGLAGDQTVTMNAGLTNVTIDSTIEDVDFTGAISAYTFKETGAGDLDVCDASGTVITTIQGAANKTLSFSDGTVAVASAGFNQPLTVGGTEVTTTAAAVVPATIDAADASSNADTSSNDDATSVDTATQNFTTSADSLTGTADNDTFKGVFGSATATDNTLSAGDTIEGGAGADTISLTAIGVTASAALSSTNVENITVRDVAGATLNAVLIESTPTISFTSTLDAQTSNVTNAALGSTFSLAGQGDMTINFLTTSGTVSAGNPDTAMVALATTGSATNSVTVDVSDTNTMEYVTVATSGTNYATITAGSSASKISVTGDGTNTLTTTGAASLEIDASASTGTNNVVLGTNFSVGDNVKGGTGADEITATVGSAGQIIATTSGVETLDLAFTAAGIMNMSSMADVTTVQVATDSAAAATITGMATTVTTLDLDSTTAGANNVTAGFAATNAAALTVNVGATDSTSANVVTDTGDLTVTSHSGALTVNSTGEAANSIDALSSSASTSLAFTGTKGFTQTGAITATAMTSLTVTADAGAMSLGTLTSDADVSSVVLSASAAEANDITITNLDVDHVQSVTINATGGADVTVTDLTFAGTNSAATPADTSTSLTLNAGTSATDTLSDISVRLLEMTNATNAVWDSIVVTGAGDVSITADDADIDVTSIAASTHTGSLTFVGTAENAAIVITTGNASSGETNTVTTGTGNDVVTGGTGVDVIVTSAGDDSITAGNGADIITGGAGSDSIDLTETASSADTINVGTGADNITSLDTTDIVNFSVAGIELFKPDGTNVVNFLEADLDGGNAAAADAIVTSTLTGALDLDTVTDGTNLLILDKDATTIASEAALETALAVGGTYALTLGAELLNDEGILVLYTDGTNSYVTLVSNTSGATIADGDTLTTAEIDTDIILTINGMTDAGTWTAANDGALA